MVKGVIFDMDGLMFDTERMWDTFWAPCLEKRGLPAPPPDFYTGCRGLAGENLKRHLKEYYPQIDPQKLLDDVWAYGARQLAAGVPCKPGLKELLAWLEQVGMPRIVASSSPRGIDVPRSKPDPAIFLEAARRLDLDPKDCLVLEDSFNGVRAGAAAGAVTIMVPDLAQPDEEIRRLYTHCCRDLLEVLDLLKTGKV